MSYAQRAWIDTEFDAPTRRLLSLALVPETGAPFYVVLDAVPEDIWVVQNVLPVLNAPKQRPEAAQRQLELWLSHYDMVHIVADWPDDIAYFAQFLITGPGMAIKMPRLTFEINSQLSSAKSRVPHNALEDAYAIRASDPRYTDEHGGTSL